MVNASNEIVSLCDKQALDKNNSSKDISRETTILDEGDPVIEVEEEEVIGVEIPFAPAVPNNKE